MKQTAYTLEKDGHCWNHPELTGDRCIYCAIRIEKYREILQGIKNNPEDINIISLAVCERLLASIIDVNCPNCGKHYHFDVTGKNPTKQIHCDCNTIFLGSVSYLPVSYKVV